MVWGVAGGGDTLLFFFSFFILKNNLIMVLKIGYTGNFLGGWNGLTVFTLFIFVFHIAIHVSPLRTHHQNV